jgi:phage shock protein E
MKEPVTPNALKSLLERDAPPLVLDVRSPEEYAVGHVPGAKNIPVDEVEGRLAEIPADRLVVPYCNMQHPGSSRGERIAELLEIRGYDARVLAGGFPAWREVGLEAEKRADDDA